MGLQEIKEKGIIQDYVLSIVNMMQWVWLIRMCVTHHEVINEFRYIHGPLISAPNIEDFVLFQIPVYTDPDHFHLALLSLNCNKTEHRLIFPNTSPPILNVKVNQLVFWCGQLTEKETCTVNVSFACIVSRCEVSLISEIFNLVQ